LVLQVMPQGWTGTKNEAQLRETEMPNGSDFDSFPL
jgi:hypothetical protein